MKIRIVKNEPKSKDCKSIAHLIGREFDVIDESDIDRGLVYIKYGDEGNGYTIFEGEYEVIV